MLEFLRKIGAPEWVQRESIYWKYTAWVCGFWFIASWIKERAQLEHPAFGYVFAVLLVWFMVGLITDEKNAEEHKLLRLKKIRIFLGKKVRSINEARPRSRE